MMRVAQLQDIIRNTKLGNKQIIKNIRGIVQGKDYLKVYFKYNKIWQYQLRSENENDHYLR